jgi:hypothetical protein
VLAGPEPPFEEWNGVWYSKWLMLGGVPIRHKKIRQ